MLSTQTIPIGLPVLEGAIGYWDAPLPEVLKHLPGQHDQATHNPYKGHSTPSGERSYAVGKAIALGDLDCINAKPLGAYLNDYLDAYLNDVYLKSIQHQQGFDGLPTIVDKEELDALIENGAVEMFRGCGGEMVEEALAHANELMNDPEYSHPGIGTLGDGLYFAAHASGYPNQHYLLAKDYAPDGHGMVRAVLRPGARVISYQDACAGVRAATSTIGDWDDEKMDRAAMAMGDNGRWAASQGYDAIIDASRRFGNCIVLNRTALIIQREPVVNPRHTATKHLPGQHDQASHNPYKGGNGKEPVGTPLERMENALHTPGFLKSNERIGVDLTYKELMQLAEQWPANDVVGVYDPVTGHAIFGIGSYHDELGKALAVEALSSEEANAYTQVDAEGISTARNEILDRSVHFTLYYNHAPNTGKVKDFGWANFNMYYAGVVDILDEKGYDKAWKNISKTQDKLVALGFPTTSVTKIDDENFPKGQLVTTLKHLPGMHAQASHNPYKNTLSVPQGHTGGVAEGEYGVLNVANTRGQAQTWLKKSAGLDWRTAKANGYRVVEILDDQGHRYVVVKTAKSTSLLTKPSPRPEVNDLLSHMAKVAPTMSWEDKRAALADSSLLTQYQNDPKMKAVVDDLCGFTQGVGREIRHAGIALQEGRAKEWVKGLGDYLPGKSVEGVIADERSTWYSIHPDKLKAIDGREDEQVFGSQTAAQALRTASVVNDAIASSPKLPVPIYRGMRVEDYEEDSFVGRHQPGMAVDIKGITSFTTNRKVAHQFATATVPGVTKPPGPVHYNQKPWVYKVKPGARGLNINALSPHSQEEIVTMGKFTVEDINPVTREVTLRQDDVPVVMWERL